MAAGSADIVKRVNIEFVASGQADVKKDLKDTEGGLKDVGKAADDVAGGKGGRGGLRGLWDSAKAGARGFVGEMRGAVSGLGGLGQGVARISGLFGQFGLAVAGVTTAIEIATDAQKHFNDTLNAVEDAAYRARQALGLTSDNFGRFAREIEAEAARAGRAVAPLFALGAASGDQRARAAVQAALGLAGPGGAVISAAAGYSQFGGAAITGPARRGGGGGGAPVDANAELQAFLGRTDATLAPFAAEFRASQSAALGAQFAGGADQTIAAQADGVAQAARAAEAAFAGASDEAMRFSEAQAAILEAEQWSIFGDVVTSTLDGVGRSMASAVVQSALLGKGLKDMAKTALVGLTVQSATEALFQTAKGFALLAVGRPDAATLAFTSAKMFAGVGAVAGVGAAALGGFGGGGGGSRASAPSASGVGDTARSTGNGGPVQVNVNVGIGRGALHDAVYEESSARGTRRGVARVATAS